MHIIMYIYVQYNSISCPLLIVKSDAIANYQIQLDEILDCMPYNYVY